MGAVKENLISTLHIDAYGTKRYYLSDVKTLHRADGPAVENGGNKEWYINGERHRIDGPALEYSDGYKAWYINGKHHRVDGPAVEEVNGYKAWWINGKRHRVDGPAVDYGNGVKEWWINGVKRSFEEWEVARKMLWML